MNELSQSQILSFSEAAVFWWSRTKLIIWYKISQIFCCFFVITLYLLLFVCTALVETFGYENVIVEMMNFDSSYERLLLCRPCMRRKTVMFDEWNRVNAEKYGRGSVHVVMDINILEKCFRRVKGWCSAMIKHHRPISYISNLMYNSGSMYDLNTWGSL
jgi:hypothetical protein